MNKLEVIANRQSDISYDIATTQWLMFLNAMILNFWIETSESERMPFADFGHTVLIQTFETLGYTGCDDEIVSWLSERVAQLEDLWSERA